MDNNERIALLPPKRRGVLIGGSGLIGGALMHHFKTAVVPEIELLSPNSKKLSLREPEDIGQYFRRYQPDFIINAAIASIGSGPQLSYEINYLGAVRLAQAAIQHGIPYIHFSSAAVMPAGENLSEDDMLPLSADLSNYTKSKLMAELTLQHLHRTQGLDYTNIRLAVVYGKHDHKIQGFQRLLFSLADQAMPMLLTRPGVKHSYSHAKKIAYFTHHALDHREECSGQTYNFVDPEPVELADIILIIKSYLDLKTPREIYIPYRFSRLGKTIIKWIIRRLSRIGIEARMPPELMFLENFYHTQTLASDKLHETSYKDPLHGVTVYSEMPDMIEYYLSRWEGMNLISSLDNDFFDPKKKAEGFLRSPEKLLASIHADELAGVRRQENKDRVL